MNGWHQYSRVPCPICGHKGWCGESDDGVVVHCMRQPSRNPCPSGGWFHFMVERAQRVPRMPRREPRPRLDVAKVMQGFRAEFEHHRDGSGLCDSLTAIAEDLKLPATDIDRLRVGWSAHHQCWAFPMLDADAHCIGIRLRRFGTSKKFSVTGSRDGLFYDPDLRPREVVVHGIKFRELVVVEGATDCIAGYAIGLPCVGRSSCATGADLLLQLCSRLRVTLVTIVADNDDDKVRTDGSVWNPGLDGARQLAQRLGRCYCIVVPPVKDLREWYNTGLTAEAFAAHAGQLPWRVCFQHGVNASTGW